MNHFPFSLCFSLLLGTFSRGYSGKTAGSSKAIGRAAQPEIATTKSKDQNLKKNYKICSKMLSKKKTNEEPTENESTKLSE